VVAEPSGPKRRAWPLVVPALTLAVGLAAGFAVGASRVAGEEEPAAVAPPTSVVVKLTATSACLEAASKADQVIDLLVTNERDRVAELLIAYSVASRQCRRDAAP
jgi:hypothetical protein